MATVVCNPTDRLPKAFQEIFNGHYKGVGKNIKPGDKIKMDDPAANHLLNEFGPRGLISLNYGDEDKIEEIIQGALKRNREWKIRQVEELNQRNESRRVIGLPFLVPTTKLKLYAEELGEEIMEPYRIKDKEKQRVTDVEKENIALKEQLKAMDDKMELLLSGRLPDLPSRPAGPDVQDLAVTQGKEVDAREIPENETVANDQSDNTVLEQILDESPEHEETAVGRLKKGGRPKKR